MKHIFLINSFSLKDKTSPMINKVNAYAQEKGLDYLIEVNDENNSTEDIIRKYKRGENILYAIGGDGLVNRVLNAMMGTKNILGIIPSGTGNDFFSSERELLTEGIHEVNVVEINDSYFINVACFGIDADIGNKDEVVHSRLIPKSQRYNAAVVKHFTKFKPRYFDIEVDGEKFDGYFSTVTVCNGRYYGGGYYVNPTGLIDDDMFDVVIVDKFSRFKLIKYILRMKKGKHIGLDGVRHIRTNEITIKCDKKVKSNVDGEVIESDIFKMKMCKKKVKVYYTGDTIK